MSDIANRWGRLMCFINLFCFVWRAARDMGDTLDRLPALKGHPRLRRLRPFTRVYRIGLN